MEQLDQLKAMRDQASVRLADARKALETSPDAKLETSLTSLIEDLEASLGLTASASIHAKTDTAAIKEEPAKKTEPVKEAKPVVAEEPTAIMDKIDKAAKKTSDSSELSLEESLEAELLAGDDASTDAKSL